MLGRLAQGIVAAASLVLLPVLGNHAFLRSPKPWILFAFGVLASVLQPAYNPVTIATEPGDRGTGAQIIWSVYVTQLAAVLESAYMRYPSSVSWGWGTVAALTAMVFGLSLRTWAVLSLGRWFTMQISVSEGQTVVRNGPYRLVRHPGYVGAFALCGSTAFFLHAWSTALAATAILALAFLRRIHHEEALLRQRVGAEYEVYCSEVGKILPWPGPRRQASRS